MENKTVILPKRKIHKTPRLLMADAYTVGFGTVNINIT